MNSLNSSMWHQNLSRIIRENEEHEEDEQEWDLIVQYYYRDVESMKKKHGGSLPGKRTNLPRDREGGLVRIMRDYFGANPIYNEQHFRRRFRMRKDLFIKIVDKISSMDSYFRQRKDAAGVLGLHPIHKVMAALRQLCYGVSADSVDEYIQIGESTALECLKRFCKIVVEAFGTEYLREPTAEDIQRQLTINELRGFPGMFASLDCTHWTWKNCPVGWQGQFQDKKGLHSIILEAACSKDLWIWHHFFGLPGSNNDINVIDRSPLMSKLLRGVAPSAEYTVNGNLYTMTYLLTDGIYPSYPVFMKTISEPQTEKRRHYAKLQESARKDIERCFGVLKTRFALFNNPCRLWSTDTIKSIMTACICLHNMICEDERDDTELNDNFLFETFQDHTNQIPSSPFTFHQLLSGMIRHTDEAAYFRLRDDLIEHQWKLKGDR